MTQFDWRLCRNIMLIANTCRISLIWIYIFNYNKFNYNVNNKSSSNLNLFFLVKKNSTLSLTGLSHDSQIKTRMMYYFPHIIHFRIKKNHNSFMFNCHNFMIHLFWLPPPPQYNVSVSFSNIINNFLFYCIICPSVILQVLRIWPSA